MTDASLQERFDAQQRARTAERRKADWPDLGERKRRLRLLRDLVTDNQALLCATLSKDFGHRSHDETFLAEIVPTLQGIDHVLRHLPRWSRSRSRRPNWLLLPSRAEVRYEPKGVVGVIVPWNYPLYLATGPLTDALAAGNRVMIKMPEALPTFSALFADLISQVFDPRLVTVIEGDVDVARAFSRLPFDHLLFTGSTAVGRQVMQAAAEHLTPVTLELGGKSPAVIGGRANLREAARRIAFGKGLNAGQTCVAPDYVLVPEYRLPAFIKHFQAACADYYPDYTSNPDYSNVVNQAHRQRLLTALEEAEAAGAKIHSPYELSADWREGAKLPLLAVTDLGSDSTLLQEEIFGPFLPIIPYRQESEAIDFIQARPNPLALYFFGYDLRSRENILNNVPSGGVLVNNTLIHIAHQQLPFGGKGQSGLGHYHGEEGFRTFSHARAVVYTGRFSTLPLLFPPYGSWVHRLLKKWFR